MNADANDDTWKRADGLVSRLKLWVATAVLCVAAISGLTAAAINGATRDVRDNLRTLNANLESQRQVARSYAVMDSVRYERAMDILELAVTAIVAPDGSPEQKSALDELKSRRHVVTREGELR